MIRRSGQLDVFRKPVFTVCNEMQITAVRVGDGVGDLFIAQVFETFPVHIQIGNDSQLRTNGFLEACVQAGFAVMRILQDCYLLLRMTWFIMIWQNK